MQIHEGLDLWDLLTYPSVKMYAKRMKESVGREEGAGSPSSVEEGRKQLGGDTAVVRRYARVWRSHGMTLACHPPTVLQCRKPSIITESRYQKKQSGYLEASRQGDEDLRL